MTWWLLILLFSSGDPPEFVDAFRSERACHAWFESESDSYNDVADYACLRVKDKVPGVVGAVDPWPGLPAP